MPNFHAFVCYGYMVYHILYRSIDRPYFPGHIQMFILDIRLGRPGYIQVLILETRPGSPGHIQVLILDIRLGSPGHILVLIIDIILRSPEQFSNTPSLEG